MKINGKFTSVWNDGIKITTDAVLYTDDNSLDIEQSDCCLDGCSILMEEYFEDDKGNVYYNVCPECHTHLTKIYMDEGIGKQLFEVTECPECGIL